MRTLSTKQAGAKRAVRTAIKINGRADRLANRQTNSQVACAEAEPEPERHGGLWCNMNRQSLSSNAYLAPSDRMLYTSFLWACPLEDAPRIRLSARVHVSSVSGPLRSSKLAQMQTNQAGSEKSATFLLHLITWPTSYVGVQHLPTACLVLTAACADARPDRNPCWRAGQQTAELARRCPQDAQCWPEFDSVSSLQQPL